MSDRGRANAFSRASQSRARESQSKRAEPHGGALPKRGDPKALFILDLSGYVFRAYHAVAPLSNSKGEPTHAVYGVTQMLKRLIDDREPKYFAVAMDSGAPSFRKDVDSRYKENRPPPPPDLASQMKRCEELVNAYRIPVYRELGLEADDLIASVAAKLGREHPDMTTVIVSADKDLMQLINPSADGARVLLWDTMRDKVYGEAEVIEKFEGIGPRQLRDMLALMGDSSDNVPGVPGVGPKTAAELLKRFPTLEALYDAVEAGPVEGIKPRIRDLLIAHKADAFVSQQLVTLKSDCDVTLDLEALTYAPPKGKDAGDLKKLFMELEFGRLADTVEAAEAITRNYEALRTPQALDEFLAQLTEARALDPAVRLALDTQSTAERPTEAALVGISLCFRPGEGKYLPIGHHYLGVKDQLDLAIVRQKLGPALADASLGKVGHNLKSDLEVLALAGLPVSGVVFDSLLAHYLLDPEQDHSLKVLAEKELGVIMTSYEEVTRKNAEKRGRQLPFDQVPIEEATNYAAADADMARDLCERFGERLSDAGLTKLLTDVEIPLGSVLAEMELAGIQIDSTALQGLAREVDQQLLAIEQKGRELIAAATTDAVARDFNMGSPKQLESMLFDTLGLKVVKRTKTGRSTDAEVLEELADSHPLPQVVLEHRQLTKLKGTYIDALPKLVSPKTGRLHTTYQQHIAATGRLSSTDPNLQNIPIRTELGRKIRAAFVAPKGFVLLSADYSQIELRVLADLSRDPILIDAFQKNEDIHERTARELFLPSGSTEAPSKEMRRRGKTVNFGVVYGQGEVALSKQLGISRSEASSFIDAYFSRYEGVARYMNEMIAIARRGEAVRTLLGRRRFLPDIQSANRMLRAQAERVARNTPIQGSAADILKLAMLALRKPVVDGARMLLTVHDELVFEVPEDKVDAASSAIRSAMANAATLSVPLVVDVGVGRTWAEAHG